MAESRISLRYLAAKEFAKMLEYNQIQSRETLSVIPAKAGIHSAAELSDFSLHNLLIVS